MRNLARVLAKLSTLVSAFSVGVTFPQRHQIHRSGKWNGAERYHIFSNQSMWFLALDT